MSNTEAVDFTVEKKDNMFVIGTQVVTSNATFHVEALPMREKFLCENMADKIPNRINQNLLAVYTDYEGDYTNSFTYMIGCEVANLDDIPEGMVGIEISPSSYAVYTAKGEFPQSMLTTWKAIWSSNMKRAYTTDFEVYEPDFNPEACPEVKIFIAINR